VFEVQIHTPETSSLAKGESHAWYEILRDPNQPAEHQRYAHQRVTRIWDPIRRNRPEGVEGLLRAL
jgi:hypothetical protein